MPLPTVLNNDQILEVLSFSENATAIYVTNNIIIQTANDAMIAFWGKDRSVIGKPLEEAVPELKGQPFKKMLQEVLRTGVDAIGNAIPATLMVDGKLQTFYYDYAYRSIKNTAGETYCILHTAADVTEKMRAIELLNISQQNLRNTVRQAPVGMCILKGNPLFVEEVNDLFLEIIGKTRDIFKTVPYWEVNAEAAPYYEHITDKVMATGETYHANEHELMLVRNGKPELLIVDFVYEPIKDINGTVNAIMIVAIEVTDKVLARRKIEKNEAELLRTKNRLEDSTDELQAINEKLRSSNEELAATNEELAATNEELAEAEVARQEMLDSLRVSEQQIRSLVESAPFPIGVYVGREMRITLANQTMLDVWGKGDNVIGKTYPEILPELGNQEIFGQLDAVFTTGIPFHARNQQVDIVVDGKLQPFFFNYSFTPVFDAGGHVYGVMNTAAEVTDLNLALQQVEQSEKRFRLLNEEIAASNEQLNLAIATANLGTWSVDLTTDSLTVSGRSRKMHGLGRAESLTLSQSMQMVLPEHREKLQKLIQKAVEQNTSFEVEYQIQPKDGSPVKWLRSTGKLYHNQAGEKDNITGTILDITERKLDELRKNDFIGMVSHELKTPLTSLSAIVQVSQAKLKHSQDAFLNSAMEKATSQVRKMNKMINGFLNVSRLESGKFIIEKQHFKLDELIREMVDEIQLTAHELTIDLHSCENIDIYADHDKIGSVLSNLLNNAVKYSSKRAHIDLTCNVTDREVQVSIKDNGIGMKAQDLDKLFDRYFRVESSNTRHISGFGIGLYLSAEIIKYHGGAIWAESQEGKGSTFHFKMPLY